MGFRNGSYATVWEVKPQSDVFTKGRISVSRKNKNTGNFEQDFAGYVTFVGTATAAKAAKLKEKDRIRLGEVDVSNRYDKEKKVEYTNYKVFTFESPQELRNSPPPQASSAKKEEDDGEIPGLDDLPF